MEDGIDPGEAGADGRHVAAEEEDGPPLPLADDVDAAQEVQAGEDDQVGAEPDLREAPLASQGAEDKGHDGPEDARDPEEPLDLRGARLAPTRGGGGGCSNVQCHGSPSLV